MENREIWHQVMTQEVTEQVTLDRYKKDLDILLSKGGQLYNAIQNECYPQEFARSVKESVGR